MQASVRAAFDALDEWMELGSLPQLFDVHPEQRELLGPGRTLHFRATDSAPYGDPSRSAGNR